MSSIQCLYNPLAELMDVQPRATQFIAPLDDPRWDTFVQKHARASVFHSTPWLKSLATTYGYRPIAYTTTPPGKELENAVVFCEVNSWLTGRRLVSLPFSDHCDPLLETQCARERFASAIDGLSANGKWRYSELRPLRSFPIPTSLCQTMVSYSYHQLELDSDLATIYRRFHKSSIQRKISRAAREHLRYCEGSNCTLMDEFYGLLNVTRKRHYVPPPPRAWFLNLMRYFGSTLKIRVAYKDDLPVAAMLTLQHKDTLVYKYGCSDSQFNAFGGIHLLFWNAIQEAKHAGLRFFDFGRTDADQQGLITFKNRWGATQTTISYLRFGKSALSTHALDLSFRGWKSRAAKYVVSHLPPSALPIAGRMLYRHAA